MTGGSTETAPAMPDRIGRYRIVRPLSKGGMALVYEARREGLGGVSVPVAMKVILPDYASSSTFRDLFINEAKLGAAMQHQNLVAIQDFSAEDGRYYLVMEYIEGLTIARMVGIAARHDLRVPLVVLCEIGRQACDGLSYAHTAVDSAGKPLGLVHRDIKPSNLMVDPQGCVKVLDFGISKGTLRPEKAGAVKGTWGYMAPEQAMGEKVGPQADLFGLGIVLYEMASRRSMFKGRGEDEIRRLLTDDHAARVAPTLDASYAPLIRLLGKAMARQPSARFTDASAMGKALAALLPDPITAREEVVRFFALVQELHEKEKAGLVSGTRAPTAPGRTAASLAAAPTATRGTSMSPWLIGLAAAGLVVLSVGALGYSVARAVSAGRDPRPEVVEAERPQPLEPPPVEAVAAPPPVVEERVVVRGEGADPPPAPDPVELPAPAPEPTRPAPKPTPAAVEPPPPPPGASLQISSLQPAEIWVDGALVRGDRLDVKPGKHTVMIKAPDGRRVAQAVTVKEGEAKRLVWDFDRWGWR